MVEDYDNGSSYAPVPGLAGLRSILLLAGGRALTLVHHQIGAFDLGQRVACFEELIQEADHVGVEPEVIVPDDDAAGSESSEAIGCIASDALVAVPAIDQAQVSGFDVVPQIEVSRVTSKFGDPVRKKLAMVIGTYTVPGLSH